MAGHLVADINQGALPAILPFLVLTYEMSYMAAGGLVLACNSVSSIIQPLLGHISDRVANPAIMTAGILLAGVGFAMVGVVQAYWLMFICVVISGIGIALFHPEGGRMVNCVAKVNKGEAMGLFSVGGSIGFAIGPLLVAILIPLLGFFALLFFLVPPVIVSVLLSHYRADLQAFSDLEYMERKQDSVIAKKDNWPGFGVLSIVIFGGSIASYGLFAFVPLFFVGILGQSESLSITMLTLLAAMCAISTYTGGKLADKYGFRKIIIAGCIVYVPLILLMAYSTGLIMAIAMVVLLGLMMKMYHSPVVSLGQQFLPNHVGLASGITLGLAVSVGGIAAPLLGWIGDHKGLIMVFITLTCLGAIMALVSFFIPKEL